MKLLAANTRKFTAPPASIGCLACHGQYFAASLPIHQKSCFQRNAFVLISCEKCRTCIRASDFRTHTASCSGKPMPFNNVSRPDIIATNQQGALAQELNLPEMDGRVRCKTCERAFSQDRITKHQSVCHGKPRSAKENREPQRRSVIPVGQGQATSGPAGKRPAESLRRKTIHAQRPLASRPKEISFEFSQGNAGRTAQVGRDTSGRQSGYPGAQRMQAGGGADFSNASSASNPLVTNPLMAARR